MKKESDSSRLLDAYFDGTLDESSRELLEQLLRSEPSVRAEFWNAARLDSALADKCQAAQTREAHPVTHRLRAVLSLAAALTLGAMLGYFLNPGSTTPDTGNNADPMAESHPKTVRESDAAPAGFIRETFDAVWSGTPAYARGAPVAQDASLKLRSGSVSLLLLDGSTVEFTGPGKIQLATPNRMTVMEGLALIQTPGDLEGEFHISVPGGTLGLVDGAVRLRAGANGRWEADALDGGFKWVPTDVLDAASRTWIDEGMRLDFDGATASSVAIPAQEMEMAGSSEDTAGSQTAERLAQWRLDSSRLAQDDPSLLVHFRFDDETAAKDALLNENRSGHASREGVVIGARWTVGRWPGKKALAFQNSGDRVRLGVPGTHPEVTLAAWVALDELQRPFNGLFFSEWGIEGEIHWQLGDAADFRFGQRPLRESAVAGPGYFHRVWSQPNLESMRSGRVWNLLVTTIDTKNRKVIHYVNGKLIAENTLPESIPVRFGAATLGNCSYPAPDVWGPRPLGGLMDEFMLFTRILSHREIEQLFREGNPG